MLIVPEALEVITEKMSPSNVCTNSTENAGRRVEAVVAVPIRL
jgi:hypothetical protein